MNGPGMSCFHLTDLLHACPNKSQIPRAVIHNDISGQYSMIDAAKEV